MIQICRGTDLLMSNSTLSLLPVIVMDAAAVVLLTVSVFYGLRYFAAAVPAMNENAGSRPLPGFVGNAGRAGRVAFFLFCISTIIAIPHLALVLPTLTPGAACGSDVLQAAGSGGAMIACRLSVLIVLYVWYHRDRIDRPMSGTALSENNLRLLMVALPLAFLHLKSTVVFARGLSVPGWVNCCAVVYDAAGNLARFSPGGRGLGLPGLLAFHVLSAVFLISGYAACRRRKIPGSAPRWIWLFTLVWGLIAYLVVVYGYADDFLMDPAPDCPWCLMLPKYRCVGVILFACLVLVGLEGFMASHVFGIAARSTRQAEPAIRRFWVACRNILLLVLLFYLVAAGTQLAWQMGVRG
jgi:hypothetical protein